MKRIKKSLIFSLLWTLFFCLFGLLYKIIKDKFFAWETLSNFFTTDYFNWLNSFYSGTNYLPATEVISAILSQWYYFFLSGGLLAIIVNLIILLFIVIFKKRTSSNQVSEEKNKIKYENPKQIKISEPQNTRENIAPISEDPRIYELRLLLEKAKQYLAEGDIMASRAVYKSIQQKYSSSLDKDKIIYNQSLKLYQDILKKLNN